MTTQVFNDQGTIFYIPGARVVEKVLSEFVNLRFEGLQRLG